MDDGPVPLPLGGLGPGGSALGPGSGCGRLQQELASLPTLPRHAPPPQRSLEEPAGAPSCVCSALGAQPLPQVTFARETGVTSGLGVPWKRVPTVAIWKSLWPKPVGGMGRGTGGRDREVPGEAEAGLGQLPPEPALQPGPARVRPDQRGLPCSSRPGAGVSGSPPFLASLAKEQKGTIDLNGNNLHL